MEILVFKTSVSGAHEVKRLTPILNKLMSNNEKWNFDLEDCDNILRIESHRVESKNIAIHLQLNGFNCEELED